jgi:hypothetical protein
MLAYMLHACRMHAIYEAIFQIQFFSHDFCPQIPSIPTTTNDQKVNIFITSSEIRKETISTEIAALIQFSFTAVDIGLSSGDRA